MRIPVTKYGLPQVAIAPAVILAAMAGVYALGITAAVFWPVEAALLIVLLWTMWFFRDPQRKAPQDKNVLLSPADGTITDIEQVEPDEYFAHRAWRIGIFLSIFNVHINRAPCAVRVGRIRYRPGAFKNAMNPHCGRVNESNDVQMFRLEEPTDELLVRQISGAIARRIVCAAGSGGQLDAGQRFGMIKFGSRTELFVPLRQNIELVVEIGDKVKAGLTVLARYK